MSKQMTFEGLNSATSSPESGDGAERFDSQEWETMSLFGLEVAPASPSQQPVGKRGSPMRATSGLYGRASSESVILQEFLESRLQARLPMDGWTKPLMTWKRKHTPSRRQYCQLAVSARPIEEIDCGLWPTPKARDYHREGQGQYSPSLAAKVETALWLTPCVPNGGRQPKNGMSLTGQTPDGKKRQVDINYVVRNLPELWPTPTAVTDTGGAALCKWGGTASRAKLRTAVTEKELNGSLNPAFPCWLMGYPAEWDACADTETQ